MIKAPAVGRLDKDDQLYNSKLFLLNVITKHCDSNYQIKTSSLFIYDILMKTMVMVFNFDLLKIVFISLDKIISNFL